MIDLQPENSVLLRLRGITKSFPGVKALAEVDFTLRRGEVHALMGENGAGKSTLIKVLTGVYQRDGGEALLENESINPHTTEEAQDLGISTVYQEVNLIPHLSVAENICLGRQRTSFGFLKWREIHQRAEKALDRLGVKIDVTETLSHYSIALQQLVAIARALDISAKMLILDEPTSSLDAQEVARLFDVLRKLKAEGLGIVFVTHFLDQVYEISDRITVLRNGTFVGEFATAELPRIQLISKMMGRELAETDFKQAAQRISAKREKPLLQLKKLGRKNSLHPLDMDIFPGETIALAGLLGSGRTETARLIFGIDFPDTGEMLFDGETLAFKSPHEAIQKKLGFCPEDRKVEAIIPNLSVRENILLAMQSNLGWFRSVSRTKQNEMAEHFIRALGIRTPHAEQPIRLLSGGNQQKVILARWLASNPRLLILDEPTRGIDVGAKLEIEKLMAKLSGEGMAILFISSDLEETVRNSGRVIVLRDRRKVCELSGEEISERRIIEAIAAPHEAE